jgi:hypothetical protein
MKNYWINRFKQRQLVKKMKQKEKAISYLYKYTKRFNFQNEKFTNPNINLLYLLFFIRVLDLMTIILLHFLPFFSPQ